MINKTLNTLLLANEIRAQTRKLEWFIFHLNRCKKESDIAKLTIFIIAEIIYIASCVKLTTKELSDIIDSLVIKKPYDLQGLLII